MDGRARRAPAVGGGASAYVCVVRTGVCVSSRVRVCVRARTGVRVCVRVGVGGGVRARTGNLTRIIRPTRSFSSIDPRGAIGCALCERGTIALPTRSSLKR